MNINLIQTVLIKTVENINLLISGKAFHEAPVFFSEKNLTKYNDNPNPYIQTWVFLCRAQRLMFDSGKRITIDEEADTKEATQLLLIAFIKGFHLLPEDIRQLLTENEDARFVLFNVLKQFSPLPLAQELVADNEWLHSMDEFVKFDHPEYEVSSSDTNDLTTLAHINLTRLLGQLKLNCGKLEQSLTADVNGDIYPEESIPLFLYQLGRLVKLDSQLKDMSHGRVGFEPWEPFVRHLLLYLHKNNAHLKQIKTYRSLSTDSLNIKNMMLKWSFYYFSKGFCQSPAECEALIQLYLDFTPRLHQMNYFYVNSLPILKEALSLKLYQKAYIFSEHILSQNFDNILCFPDKTRNLFAVLCYLSAVDQFIEKHYFGPLEFNIREADILKHARFNIIPDEIKTTLNEACFYLLVQMAKDMNSLQSAQEKQIVLDIYKRLSPLLNKQQERQLRKDFQVNKICDQLALTLFGANEGKKEKPLHPLITEPTITLPREIIEFCKPLESTWYLCGAAVFELDQGYKPNDYDMLVIGINSERLQAALKLSNTPFKVMSKKHPIVVLSLAKDIELEISCIENPSNKPVKELLLDEFNRRDYKPCALFVEIPEELKPATVISFNQALKQSRKKKLDTTIDPALSFSSDPLRILRLIKWQIKHPAFRLHHRLKKYLTADSTSWANLMKSQPARASLSGRFRTAMIQLLQRFSLNELIKQDLFISFLSDLSQLDKHTVQTECAHIAEITEEKSLQANVILLYLLFNLYLSHWKEHDGHCENFHLKQLIYLTPMDQDYFNSFSASQTGENADGTVFDARYFSLLERHGFQSDAKQPKTSCQ